nr:MAG TPA: Protein of unknown function (DUF4446) [Caudoviricetes sp.]
MKQSECMSIINRLFNERIKSNEHIFKSYCYFDHRACDLIVNFKKDVEKSGFKFSNCYHANGIGNNNDYTIYLESHDDDGFVIKKEIANFYYCYGIYGGCSVYVKDLVTGNRIAINCAR